jgi:hypothetical protein
VLRLGLELQQMPAQVGTKGANLARFSRFNGFHF